MKIDKISLDGKRTSIEVKDVVFSAKVNEKLISEVIYKTNANYKGRKAKTKQKNEITGSTSKIYAQKALVTQDTQVVKRLYLLEEVLHMDPKVKLIIKKGS